MDHNLGLPRSSEKLTLSTTNMQQDHDSSNSAKLSNLIEWESHVSSNVQVDEIWLPLSY